MRIALGATPSDVRSLVVLQTARLAAAGVAIGLVGAIAASRALLSLSLLFGVSAVDPATFAVAAGGLMVASLAACYQPARRAARIDPVDLLR